MQTTRFLLFFVGLLVSDLLGLKASSQQDTEEQESILHHYNRTCLEKTVPFIFHLTSPGFSDIAPETREAAQKFAESYFANFPPSVPNPHKRFVMFHDFIAANQTLAIENAHVLIHLLRDYAIIRPFASYDYYYVLGRLQISILYAFAGNDERAFLYFSDTCSLVSEHLDKASYFSTESLHNFCEELLNRFQDLQNDGYFKRFPEFGARYYNVLQALGKRIKRCGLKAYENSHTKDGALLVASHFLLHLYEHYFEKLNPPKT